jgi:predicted dehydrogenase
MNNNLFNASRRKFLHDVSLATIGTTVLSSFTGSNTKNKEGKLGVALVGLGGYATGQLAPALQQTTDCYLAGIVTGTPAKAEKFKSQYNIPDKNIYNYQTFDQIKDNPDIDVIYVVLPNSMHADYVVRAAKTGKHVICEKPMAITVKDCDRMIEACRKAGVTLSVGYRLHFEPHHLEAQRLGQQKVYGAVKKMNSGFGFSAQPGIWRLNKEMAGGGPLMDVGIYCIQAFCYATGLEPIAVRAQEGQKTDLTRFKDVEQSLTWQFEMPGGIIAEGKASYADNMNSFRADAERGWFEISPAFNYGGVKGQTSDGPMNFPAVNQQARQLDGISQAIKAKKPSPVPGEMGRRDVKYLQAIYEAMRTGKRVEIAKG